MGRSTGIRALAFRPFAAKTGTAIFFLIASNRAVAANSYPLQVLPPEHKRMTDPKTGAELLFLTTAPENDANLYFHEHS